MVAALVMFERSLVLSLLLVLLLCCVAVFGVVESRKMRGEPRGEPRGRRLFQRAVRDPISEIAYPLLSLPGPSLVCCLCTGHGGA